MNYPDWLTKSVANRSQGFLLEGFVPGAGPKDARLVILGEAPGRKEIASLVPFSGAAGVELDKNLTLAGIQREQIYITSAVRSRPYRIQQGINRKTGVAETKYPNRTPTKKEVLAHASITDYELQTIQPEIIIPLGNIGLHRLLGPKRSITQDHGQIITSPVLELNADQDGYQWGNHVYTLVPMFHPAAIFYNRKLAPLIEQDWTNLGELLHTKS